MYEKMEFSRSDFSTHPHLHAIKMLRHDMDHFLIHAAHHCVTDWCVREILEEINDLEDDITETCEKGCSHDEECKLREALMCLVSAASQIRHEMAHKHQNNSGDYSKINHIIEMLAQKLKTLLSF